MNYLQKKKLAFMSIVNQVKGFVRTVSGIPPLTLPACVDTESVIDYTIEGASGDVGDLTENLFDNTRGWNTVGQTEYPTFGGSDVVKLDGGGYRVGRNSSFGFNFKNLTVGETYALSFDVTTVKAGTHVIITPINGGNPNHQYLYGITKKRLSTTFKATATTRVGFGYSPPSGNYTSKVDITNIMLVKGSTAKAYEPYGYKIPIVCSGKNKLALPYTTDNRLVSKANLTAEFSFKVEIGKAYTFSFRDNMTGFNASNLAWCLSYGNTYSWSADPNNIFVTIRDENKCMFTATKDTVYFIGGCLNGKNEYWDFQLEEGSSKTAYEKGVEPTTTNLYLSAPLEDGESINYKEDHLPILPTVQGTTIYTVGTEVQPNMIVTYYSTQKG